MSLLKKIKIKNFECFRDEEEFDFDSATFFIGSNNSGKSAIFRALCLFFDELEFEHKFLNQTVFKAKKTGSNVSEITITFDLTKIKMKAFKLRLLKLNKKSDLLNIKARYIFRETYTDEIFEFNNKKAKYEDLDSDIQKLIESVKINFIHPQQGAELLEKAQEKLQNRLLDNWGRTTKLSQELNKLNKEWQKYREEANFYLSNILTDRIKKFWGQGKVSINLPASIKEVIKIGDVSFQASENLPEITLTSHGTGVQQSLLYYASFILDSDRTLRRNQEYHPVWLLEEPESFLHADMIIKLGKDLTSNEWLENIQLLSTTHSGLLLANSMNAKNKILWNILSKHKLKSSYNPNSINDSKIQEIGRIMGDPNFEIFFNVNKNPIFIEDTDERLINKLSEEEIEVKGLGSIDEIKKYISVLKTNNFTKAFFIIDNDLGFKKIKTILTGITPKDLGMGFSEYNLNNQINILVLPEGWAMESLFEGFDSFIDESVPKLIGSDKKLLDNIPRIYTKTCTKLHSRHTNNPVDSVDEVKELLKQDDNLKHYFWNQVGDNIYDFKSGIVDILKSFIKK